MASLAQSSPVRWFISKLGVPLPTLNMVCRQLLSGTTKLALATVFPEHCFSPPLVLWGIVIADKLFRPCCRMQCSTSQAELLLGGGRGIRRATSGALLSAKEIWLTAEQLHPGSSLLSVDRHGRMKAGASPTTVDGRSLAATYWGSADGAYPAGRASIVIGVEGDVNGATLRTDSFPCYSSPRAYVTRFSWRKFEMGLRTHDAAVHLFLGRQPEPFPHNLPACKALARTHTFPTDPLLPSSCSIGTSTRFTGLRHSLKFIPCRRKAQA